MHAQLHIGAENSGKLVTWVRAEARRVALQKGLERIVVDGAPGIGCPVIASLTAASVALVVTEPMVSGEHDLLRVLEPCRRLHTPAMVCINRWDINPDMSETLQRLAQIQRAPVAGMVGYEPTVTAAQRAEKTVIEYGESAATRDLRAVWASASDFAETRGRDVYR